MSDNYGACVVLIPESNELPNLVEGGQHITLAYLGDDLLDNDTLKELVTICSEIARSVDGEQVVAYPIDVQNFGADGDAVVITMYDGSDSYPVTLRNELLEKLSPRLMSIFEEAETFPDYKPHMTLGYLSEGYEEEPITLPDEMPIRALGLWNGNNRIEFVFNSPEPEIAHYGILRKSGRYPWGSGENPNQRNKAFLDYVKDLENQGMTTVEIARGLGEYLPDGETVSTRKLVAAMAIAKNEQRAARVSQAERLKEAGHSNVEIGRIMGGLNESTVRSLLDPAAKENQSQLITTANMLKDQIKEKTYLDVGEGTENHLGITQSKLATAVAMLEEEGYSLHKVKTTYGGDHEVTIKVLAPPETPWIEVQRNKDRIRTVSTYSEDNGKTYLGIEPPESLSPNRVKVRYGDEGGSDKDGIIEIRRGVEDLNLGQARYAQSRIKVGKDHYLKGMVMYSDDLPDGVDVIFNTNKKNTGNKLDAMKDIKSDPDNPFGSVIRQKHYIDSKGKKKLSPINIVGTDNPDGDSVAGEEGGWNKWSKTLSSQMLSKQSTPLAKKQLKLAYDIKKSEYDEIMALTNPEVRKKLLQSFSDGADAAAVNLKAAGLPRTRAQVILPINSLKDNEIYAPNYKQGETVVLIRHPHGGIFEIPQLTVNNKNKEGNRLIPNAKDAVGINAKVASQLSGADFDGDTVLVIPNNTGAVKVSKPLAELKNFEPQRMYAPYDGMKTIDGGTYNSKTRRVEFKDGKKSNPRAKQREMGSISNLITDMTIKKANDSEIAKAVRHSMVVIDAEKHHLNYKQSYIDNGIKALKERYQKDTGGSGADTLISKAKSEIRVDERKDRSAKNGGRIDPITGKKMYEPTDRSYVNSKGVTVKNKTVTTRMDETDDARTLSSGTAIESVYADHANRLKALANQARKELYSTPNSRYSKTAAKTYAPQVTSLKAKLNVALKNKPLERQARLIAAATVKAKRQANPELDRDAIKKIESQALRAARERTGASRKAIQITPAEWRAIQEGAISSHFLNQILTNTDLDLVKKYATPRESPVMSSAKLARAQSMMASGYTYADVADALGVPTSTLHDALG
mgnify:CR=1 FL=1